MFKTSVFDWMQENPGAVLTWYSPEGRLEFTGPVLSRWIAKVANYIVETFGEDEEPSVILDLPDSWRTLVWATGVGMAGGRVTVSDSADLSDADIFVTTDEGVAGETADSEPGLIVMLQDLGLLATSWQGDLPDGVDDAIEELNGQPDALTFASVHDANAPSGMPVSQDVAADGPVVVMADAPGDYIARTWAAWASQRPALWIDPGLDTQHILRQERLA
ncbi:MAG: TIGR03089 family protein [Actinomycetaceae bacterium]|nr:TIGR03089 family protein [Actinomycetaceae bacterium]